MDELTSLHEEHLSSLLEDEIDEYLLDCQEYISAGDVAGWKERFTHSSLAPVKRTRGSPSRVLNQTAATCVECHSSEVIDDVKQGQIVCTDCGLVQSHHIYTATFQDTLHATPIRVHRYSRIVYFKSVLRSLMGDTRPQLVKDDIDKILTHLRTPITPDTIVVALKASGLDRLRRHRVSLSLGFGGTGGLTVDATVYTQLLVMFRQVECAYTPAPKRRVFLSYPYLLYQFLYHHKQPAPKTLLLKCRHLLARQHKLYGPIAKKLDFKAELDVFRK
jgi:hypothetical protein